MKKITIAALIAAALTQSGCTVLRYRFEPALNSVPKDATITRVTNDYIEYSRPSTNVFQATNVINTPYRAYYDTSGKIYKINTVRKDD